MSAQVRVAGHAPLSGGATLVWSVADGRRGRRWRAAIVRDGATDGSLLLEVGVDGRPSRLELTTPVGLLTLHPEPAGGLHGNAVTTDGVRHLALDWSDAHGLEVDGFVVASAVTASRLAATTPVGEGRVMPVVAVGVDLAVVAGTRRYQRLDASTWSIDGPSGTERLEVDGRGLPIWPAPAGEWPLELDRPAGGR